MKAEPVEIRRKRLLYLAQHRGFKEADLVVGGFAAAALPTMSEAELTEFERLLHYADTELYAWITGDLPPPEDVQSALFSRLRAFIPARKGYR